MIQLKKIKKLMDDCRGKFLIIYNFYKLSSKDTIKKLMDDCRDNFLRKFLIIFTN